MRLSLGDLFNLTTSYCMAIPLYMWLSSCWHEGSLSSPMTYIALAICWIWSLGTLSNIGSGVLTHNFKGLMPAVAYVVCTPVIWFLVLNHFFYRSVIEGFVIERIRVKRR
jgi:hypothetical protein